MKIKYYHFLNKLNFAKIKLILFLKYIISKKKNFTFILI